MQNDTQNPVEHFHDEESFSDPYQVIAEFFDLCSISSHRRDITNWMEAVNKSDYWQKSCPSELLFYYEKLVTLIRAVHVIYKEDKERKTAVDLLEEKGYDVRTNLLHPALYVGWTRDHTLWKYFPRSLSREEYIDPYLVFPVFFALYDLEEWCHELHELLSGALSSDSMADLFGAEYDILLIQNNLLKLVEAAHLIDVREVDYVGDFKKRPPYTLDKPLTDIALAKVFKMLLPEDENNILMLLEEDDEDGEDEDNEGHDTENDDENRDEEEYDNDRDEDDDDEDDDEDDDDDEYSDNDEDDEDDDNDGGEDDGDDTDNDEEAGQEHDHPGKREGSAKTRGHAFVEVMIRGNCLVNDRPVGLEPVKINIPINVSDD